MSFVQKSYGYYVIIVVIASIYDFYKIVFYEITVFFFLYLCFFFISIFLISFIFTNESKLVNYGNNILPFFLTLFDVIVIDFRSKNKRMTGNHMA